MQEKHRFRNVILNGKTISGTFDCEFSDSTIMLTKVEGYDLKRYFFNMDAEKQAVVENWLFGEVASDEREKEFISHVAVALKKVEKDYWISTIEPSIAEDKKIKFEIGKNPAVGITKYQWLGIAKKYAPEYGSRLATYFELILWYCYRAYTMDIHVRKLLQNYRIEPELVKTGSKNVLGFSDGITNTVKVTTLAGKPILVGKPFNGEGSITDIETDGELKFSTGVIVLSD